MISLSGVGRHFDVGGSRVDVLRDVNVTIAPGEFVSLLGPSGCGKSTLLMIAAGLDRPDDGVVQIFGEPIAGPYRGTGIVFQDPTLLPWKSALDNVLLPLEMKGLRTASYRDRAIALLETTGLAEALDRRPRQLSGGMRQRVALCRALIEDPDILFLDEPFSALDAISRDEMNAVLLDLWTRFHKTALFVTHSVREAVLLSDRIFVMGKDAGVPIADVDVPFSRPRDFSLTRTAAFAGLCEDLHERIAVVSPAPARKAVYA